MTQPTVSKHWRRGNKKMNKKRKKKEECSIGIRWQQGLRLREIVANTTSITTGGNSRSTYNATQSGTYLYLFAPIVGSWALVSHVTLMVRSQQRTLISSQRITHMSTPLFTSIHHLVTYGVARILSGVHFFPQKSWRPFFSRRPQKTV